MVNIRVDIEVSLGSGIILRELLIALCILIIGTCKIICSVMDKCVLCFKHVGVLNTYYRCNYMKPCSTAININRLRLRKKWNKHAKQ